MSLRGRILYTAILLVSAGCTHAPPQARMDALTGIYAVRLQGGEKEFPAEFASSQEAFSIGDRLLQEGEKEGAEKFYQLALGKAQLLRQKIELGKARQTEARLKAEEESREIERQKAVDELKIKLLAEQERVERESRRKSERLTQVREREKEQRPLPQFHTVKRGETLPQIAAQMDIYNDASLWPLIYRANRDQVRDPRRIWPGQVLRIPRNVSREDIAEARKYAQERHMP